MVLLGDFSERAVDTITPYHHPPAPTLQKLSTGFPQVSPRLSTGFSTGLHTSYQQVVNILTNRLFYRLSTGYLQVIYRSSSLSCFVSWLAWFRSASISLTIRADAVKSVGVLSAKCNSLATWLNE